MIKKILIIALTLFSQYAIANVDNLGPKVWITGEIVTNAGYLPPPANSPTFNVISGDLKFSPPTINSNSINGYGMLVVMRPGTTGVVVVQYPNGSRETSACKFTISLDNNLNATAAITTLPNSIITCTSSGNPNSNNFVIDITPTNPNRG